MSSRAGMKLPKAERHTNRMPFEGVLTLIDTPSDKAPSGARGHRLLLLRTAVARALPGLIGMGVNFEASWMHHDVRNKVGIFTEAWIDEDRLRVRGIIWARDFPELLAKSKGSELGMSFEAADVHIEDMRQLVWLADVIHFTGATVLLREHAAWRATEFTMLPGTEHESMGPLPAQPEEVLAA